MAASFVPSLLDRSTHSCVCDWLVSKYLNRVLENSGLWVAASSTVPAGDITIDYVGTTDDGSFNTGTGWSIDDVSVECPATGTPATSTWGLFLLMIGISMAMAVALFRLRKQSVRG